jgi:predicted Ser/Thr protein kinase
MMTQQDPNDLEQDWQSFLEREGIRDIREQWVSPLDIGRRVILHGDLVTKFVMWSHDQTSDQRNGNLQSEYVILKLLESVKGVPVAYCYDSDDVGARLDLEHIDATSWAARHCTFVENMIILTRVLAILWQVSSRGVAHLDLRLENILIDSKNYCYIIDFDQSVVTTSFNAVLANFMGLSRGDIILKQRFGKTVIKKILPTILIDQIRKIRHGIFNTEKRKLPEIEESTAIEVKRMIKAWQWAQKSDANAPGDSLAYYSLEFEGVKFPGERPWEERWEVLSKIEDFRGRRVLELGCNMGLLSTYLMKFENASAAIGVDYEQKIIESADIVSEVFGVNVRHIQADFDRDDNWEQPLIDFEPDVVFALNVLNWLDDKQRFLNFLGQFNTVIIEGHESKEVEVERLKGVGFRNHNLIHISERGRPIIRFSKEDC